MMIDTHTRLPKDLHGALSKEARRLGLTLNQFYIMVLSAGLKALGGKL